MTFTLQYPGEILRSNLIGSCLLVVMLTSCHHPNKKDKIYQTVDPRPEKSHATKVIADKWNIEFCELHWDNCLDQLMDSIERFNKTADSIISAKHGKNWKERFDREVDSEFLEEQRSARRIKK